MARGGESPRFRDQSYYVLPSAATQLHHHLHPHDSDPDQGRRGESRAANKGSRRFFNQARRNPFLGPSRTFSLLKVAFTALPFKNKKLLRHYAK